MQRARDLYENRLGLMPSSFKVDDIGAALAALKKAGVVFEDSDLPGLRTVDQVCVLGSENAVWFKDTEGNDLCFHEDIFMPGVYAAPGAASLRRCAGPHAWSPGPPCARATS